VRLPVLGDSMTEEMSKPSEEQLDRSPDPSEPAADPAPATRGIRSESSATRSSLTVLLRRTLVVVLGAALVALATYGISRSVPATYSSSADVVVLVNGTDVNDTTLGANNLADQYAQIVASGQVLSIADQLLKAPAGAIPTTAITGAAVGAQNEVSITATAASANLAQRRAAVVTGAFIKYVTQLVANQAATYARTSTARLAPVNAEIANTQRELEKPGVTPTSTKGIILQQSLATLLSEKSAGVANIAETAESGLPSFRLDSSAGPGAQIAPKPTLYAAVGFVVALLLLTRLVFYFDGQRSSDRPKVPAQ
jgi:capsular polysaccharide biosynthesis protein